MTEISNNSQQIAANSDILQNPGKTGSLYLPSPVVVGQSQQFFEIRSQHDMLIEIHRKLHQELGIPANYGGERKLPCYEEASDLIDVGPNLVGRMQRLAPEAAAKWQQMVETAAGSGVRLLIVSGFRSYEHQAELIRKKIAAGRAIDEVLKVNAAPCYSQHHTGTAIDIATPGSRPLTEEFETSDAFKWLTEYAAEYGFSMTYPRDNRFGFVYEPWHWAF